tara:strand:- start:637 stop:1194 length:558 start_codon:yes stop_codon:yes gene_type:complete
MTLALTPELGIEIPENIKYTDLCVRAEAACNTIKELEEQGLVISPSDQDKDVASTLVTSYAQNAKQTSKAVSNNRMSSLTPAALIQTHTILKEFGHLVAEHAAEVRNMVVNKLIIETESPKDSTRMQALISLGKMPEVGLFTERKEITVTHQNSDELKERLRAKLEILKQNAEGVYEMDSKDLQE